MQILAAGIAQHLAVSSTAAPGLPHLQLNNAWVGVAPLPFAVDDFAATSSQDSLQWWVLWVDAHHDAQAALLN